MSKIKETAAFIQDKIDGKFDVGVVLGSGLGDFIDAIENKIEIPYEDIVHYQKIIYALTKTDELMKKIDDICFTEV